MKTLKSALGVIILFLACATANAAVNPNAKKLTKDDVVGIYVDAVTRGDIKGLDNVLDDSLQYDVKRGADTQMLHKDDLMTYLSSNPVAPASVSTTTTVVEDGDRHSKIRVDFNYGNYTRSDLITLDEEGGWMITKIESTFS
jgi:hypothetical protein